MKQTRLIFKCSIARKLLQNGYRIIDLKPQKQLDGSFDFTRTIFVFEYKDGIDDLIKTMTAKQN